MTDKSQQPLMPGDAAKRRGETPAGDSRNEDNGKGQQSGEAADKAKHEQAQDAELEMNERNR